jgi:hypothetical protein
MATSSLWSHDLSMRCDACAATGLQVLPEVPVGLNAVIDQPVNQQKTNSERQAGRAFGFRCDLRANCGQVLLKPLMLFRMNLLQWIPELLH